MNVIRYQENVKKWIDGKISGNNRSKCLSVKSFVKRFLFDTHGNKCEKCGWAEKNEFTGLIPLHVHHIDGDCSNTVPSNLQLLCPNCHSLTETFCSLNIGNSRREF